MSFSFHFYQVKKKIKLLKQMFTKDQHRFPPLDMEMQFDAELFFQTVKIKADKAHSGTNQ